MKTQRCIGICSLLAVSFPMLTSNVGCASIMSGSTQLVQFTSNPDGAQVEIVSKRGKVIKRFETPNSVELKRGRGFFAGADLTLRATGEGHGVKDVKIPTHLNGWYWGNVLFGGLLGMLIVDPITGGMFTFPEHVHIDFEGEDSMSWFRKAEGMREKVAPLRSFSPEFDHPARDTLHAIPTSALALGN